MRFVIDASVAIKWVVPEADSIAASELIGQDLSAPAILPVECANALWAKMRRKELTRPQAEERLDRIIAAPISIAAADGLLTDAFDLSARLDHPIYDCLYVALAASLGVALVTADERLWRAARADARVARHVVRLREVRVS